MGSPQIRPKTPVWRLELLVTTELEVLWGFSSFFLWNILSDMNRIVESILSDLGSWLPASAGPTHSQLMCHVEAPSDPLRRGWDVNSPIPSAPQPPPASSAQAQAGGGEWAGVSCFKRQEILGRRPQCRQARA